MGIRRLLLVTVVVAMTAGLALVPRAADSAKRPKSKPTWVHPDFERFGVDRIGMLPVATYDNNKDTERIVQNQVAMSFKDAGFRWLSGTATRALLKIGEGGAELSKATREDILEDARLDSVAAGIVCAKLRIDAVLTVRVDRWEKREIESNVSGKPSTMVYMKAALVDSSGVLLWRATGAEVVEGLYRQARSSEVGSSITGLGVKAVTGAGGAPSYAQALEQLLIPWAESFPRKPKPSSESTSETKSKPKPKPKPKSDS